MQLSGPETAQSLWGLNEYRRRAVCEVIWCSQPRGPSLSSGRDAQSGLGSLIDVLSAYKFQKSYFEDII